MTAQPVVNVAPSQPFAATPMCQAKSATTALAPCAARPTPETESDEVPLNYAQLVRRCMGKIELAERLLASFCERCSGELTQLEACFAAGNSERLSRLAHQLKGTAANVSATNLQAVTGRLEESVRAGRSEEIAAQLAAVRRAWERFQDFRALLAPNANPTDPSV